MQSIRTLERLVETSKIAPEFYKIPGRKICSFPVPATTLFGVEGTVRLSSGHASAVCSRRYLRYDLVMIISRGRRFVFVHIPKTGGTSMAVALEARAMADDILIGDTPKARKRKRRLHGVSSAGRLWKHSTLADIAGVVPDEVIDTALVFSLVRNPWDRVFSFYCWAQTQDFTNPMVEAAQRLSFSAFLNAPSVFAALQADPYARYVTDAAGRERSCLWIRLEHWRADGLPLWDHLGFRLDLPHVNRSDRSSDYRAAYSREDARIVESACATDIERFGYEF